MASTVASGAEPVAVAPPVALPPPVAVAPPVALLPPIAPVAPPVLALPPVPEAIDSGSLEQPNETREESDAPKSKDQRTFNIGRTLCPEVPERQEKGWGQRNTCAGPKACSGDPRSRPDRTELIALVAKKGPVDLFREQLNVAGTHTRCHKVRTPACYDCRNRANF